MKMMFLLLSLFSSHSYSSDGPAETIHCNCNNKRAYTLVFDAGMGNWSVFFKPLSKRLGDDFRICLLDRPGYHRSSKVGGTLDALSIARNMKRVLSSAGIEDSIVLVGHSMGGLNIRMFQNLYPDMVAGMILLDAANPNLLGKMPEIEANLQFQIKQMKKIKRLAKFGVLKFAKKQIPTFGLPEEFLEEYYDVVTKPFYYGAYIQELEILSQSLEQCKALPSLNDLPLLVVSSKKGLNNSDKQSENLEPDLRWIELQKELTLLSSNAVYLESNEDHFLHLSDIDFVANGIEGFCDTYFNSL